MALLKKQQTKDITYINETAALIQRRRLQIIVNSYIYYELNKNLITDQQWDKWAKELVQLQALHPELCKQVIYHKEFKGFDASTGFHFKYDNRIRKIARRLVDT